MIGALLQRARKTLKGQFIMLAILILALTVTQGISVSQNLQGYASALDTIHNSSSPSIDAAQAPGQYIDGIDAKAADYLATAGLSGSTPCRIPGEQGAG